jgi:hypothetical protein
MSIDYLVHMFEVIKEKRCSKHFLRNLFVSEETCRFVYVSRRIQLDGIVVVVVRNVCKTLLSFSGY